MQVKIKKLHPHAKVPAYQTHGAACFDIQSTETGAVPARHAYTFSTGLAFEIPEGYAMLVFSRSGDGFRRGVRLANGVGVIDSDYRGELLVCLHNDSLHPKHVVAGDRIAQAMLVPSPAVTFTVVEELSGTERGTNGFGSTGK